MSGKVTMISPAIDSLPTSQSIGSQQPGGVSAPAVQIRSGAEGLSGQDISSHAIFPFRQVQVVHSSRYLNDSPSW